MFARSDLFQPLPRKFYAPSASVVAPRLLGHYLVRKSGSGSIGGVIVETEAYIQGDPACHAYVGLTNRTRTMFGPPGHAYIYIIYGVYWCFNTVCCREGVAEAVLVRAIEPIWGIEQMQASRSKSERLHLASGPGKLCKALGLDRNQDGADLTDPNSAIWVAENPEASRYVAQQGGLFTTTRVGITKAADWPLRFYLKNSPFVSRRVRTS
jgi:DNA-3-methyladenine glycosylase